MGFNDRELGINYDKMLQEEPEKSVEKWWKCKVTVTLEFEGSYQGTKDHVEVLAVENALRHLGRYDEEYHTVESEVDYGEPDD